VNIPFDQPVSQSLYKGTSEQQVDALTDLLMHFDTFAKRNLSLEAYLRQQPAAPAAGQAPPSGPAGQPSRPVPAGQSLQEKQPTPPLNSRPPGVALN
jgi:hypothetical protein